MRLSTLDLPRRAAALAAAAALVLAAGSLLGLLLHEPPPLLVPRAEPLGPDPLSWAAAGEAELERNAAFGLSRPLYALSPGGVEATAERVARFRPLVEEAVAGSGFSADTLEAMVFLESGGRPDAIAGGSDPVAASGLAQIVAETGTSFLGMSIDLAESRRLTRAIAAAATREEEERLIARRAEVDPRFDPERALRAAVRYLVQARELLGRNDLAVASYHMGIGNLRGVIERYGAGTDVPWARLFFDSSPARNAGAWARLNELGDDTRNYYWKVLAAEQIMRLHRTDPERLAELARLHASKGSAEEVLRPPGETERFASPRELERAWRRGAIQPLPADPVTTHVTASPAMGELAARLDREPELYRGLRPEALAVLLHMGREVHALSEDPTPLVVTSTVRDEDYQEQLAGVNPEATAAYSLHTTGYAFDLSRAWGSGRQAAAMQFTLERLQAHGIIAWVREPEAIHVTVGPLAAPLVGRYLREER